MLPARRPDARNGAPREERGREARKRPSAYNAASVIGHTEAAAQKADAAGLTGDPRYAVFKTEAAALA